MGREIKVSVDNRDLEKWAKEASGEVVDTINKSIRRSANYAVRVFRRNLNGNTFTGNLKRSVRYKFIDKISVDVGPEARYAGAVEFGTRPHSVSYDDIEKWALSKGLDPGRVKKNIERFGTRKHPYLGRTYEEVSDWAVRDLRKTVNKKVEEWNGGK